MSEPVESPSAARHKALAAEHNSISLAVVTVSDSRTPETDTNFHYLRDAVLSTGFGICAYHLIKDEPEQVIAVLQRLASDGKAQVVFFNGGTGISRRDTTFDALNRCLEKTLPGFGEIFRMLSYQQIGSAAMFSRATAGVYRGMVIISTPGSPAAVRLAWEKLILPEIQHLVWEVNR
jgi:molybdenum cofactor biosynthesis protein B